ncbi:MAG: hypothetical protein ACQEXJ_07630 [Myxococcota bacterium]
MSAGHETLLLEAGGPGAEALSPGRIQRALALGAGVRSEEIGALEPLGRGRVAVDVALARALSLSTPRPIPLLEGDDSTVLLLRRPDDPPEEGEAALLITWSDGGGAPSPGALAAALSEASGGSLGPEEIGAGFVGPGWLRLTAPARVLVAVDLPARVTAGGRTLDVAVADGGKKKS